MKDLLPNLLRLGSSFVLALVLWFLFRWFHLYDWEHAFYKAVFYAFMLTAIIGLWGIEHTKPLSTWVFKVEFACFAVLVAYLTVSYGSEYLPDVKQAPKVDHSYFTVVASKGFWEESRNPYTNPEASPRMLPWSEQEGVRGFSNGPFLLAGYSLSAPMGGVGLKLSNLIYFVLTGLVVFLILLESAPPDSRWQTLSGLAFAAFVLVSSERYWFEILTQGAIDIFPVLLILVSAYFGMRKNWFLAGLFGGLSLSAKIIPAAVYLFLFARKDIKMPFVIGVSAGLVPFVAFLVWSPEAFLTNSIFNHATKGYDSTSLYSLMPEDLHFLFTLAKVTAAGFIFIKNFNRELSIPSILKDFLVLMIIIEITFTEVHGNHLIWFIPFIAIVFSWFRYDLFGRLKSWVVGDGPKN